MIIRKLIILIYLVVVLNYQLCDSKYLSEFKDVNSNFFNGNKNSHYSFDRSCCNDKQQSILKRAVNSKILVKEEQYLRPKIWTPNSIFSADLLQAPNKFSKSSPVHFNQDNDEISAYKERIYKRNNKFKGLRYSQDFHINSRGREADSKNQFRLNRKRKHIFNNLRKPSGTINFNELSTLYKNENKSEVKINNNPLYQPQIQQELRNTEFVSSTISDCINKKRHATSQVTQGLMNDNGIASKLNSSVVNTDANTSIILSKCKCNLPSGEKFDILRSFLETYNPRNVFNGNRACQKNGCPIMFGFTASPMTIKKLQNFTYCPFYHQKYIQSLLSDNQLIANVSTGPYNTSYCLPNDGSKNRNNEFSEFTDERSIFETQTINSFNQDDSTLIEPVLSLADTSSYPKNFTLVLALVPYPDTSTKAVLLQARSTTSTKQPLKYLFSCKNPMLDIMKSNGKKDSSAITVIIPATIITPFILPETTPCPAPALTTPGTPAPVTTVATTTTTPTSTTTTCSSKTTIFHCELRIFADKSKVVSLTTDVFGDIMTIDNDFWPVTSSSSKSQRTNNGDGQTSMYFRLFNDHVPTNYPTTKFIYGGELDG